MNLTPALSNENAGIKKRYEEMYSLIQGIPPLPTFKDASVATDDIPLTICNVLSTSIQAQEEVPAHDSDSDMTMINTYINRNAPNSAQHSMFLEEDSKSVN